MTHTFDCAMCLPGCRLSTDEDDIEPPHRCPWPEVETASKWQEVAE